MPLVPSYIENLEPYRPGGTIEEIQEKYGLSKIVKLASNENPFGPSPLAVEAMRNVLNDIHRYPDAGGIKLRTELAKKYSVKVENVVLGNGSEGIMSCIMRTFLTDEDEIIATKGSFTGFNILARASGKKIVWSELTDYRFNLENMIPLITEKTKIIYLCNPNNPTGTIFTRDEFDNFYRHVPERALIIMDEAYFEFAEEFPDYPNSMHYRYDNVITLRTFSKAQGLAGVRIGYGMAHERLISNIMKIKLPFEPNLIAQHSALAALKDQAFLQKCIDENRRARNLYYDFFDSRGLSYKKSYTNFVMIDFGSEETVTRIHLELLKQGVMVRPLKFFDLPICLRISTGKPDENEFCIEKLKHIL